MKKILLIAPTFGMVEDNSIQAMMSAYKTALNLSKYAHVIVLSAGPKPRYERINNRLEVYRLWNIYLKDPVNYMIAPGLFWHTVRLIRKEKPDIYLVNKFMFSNAFIVPFLKILGKKIYTQIDAFPSIDWVSRTPWIRPIMWLYLRLIGLPILWMSDWVILFHEGMVPIAKRFRIKYRVIHNGVNFENIDRATIAPEVIKEKPEAIHLGYVGRLESMKGYDVLLNACSRLLPSYPHVKLFIIGNTRGKETIVQKFQNNQIRFLGVRNDVPSLLKGIDIFILPSFSEGLSNSLMEAMAAGCACIAMDISGGNQILIKDGVTGLLAKLKDKDDLKKKICHLIENQKLRRWLGGNARILIKEKFNWDVIVQQYLQLFEKGNI